MQNRYKTDYSNQVHQLNVVISKHFYITSGDKFKYQKKVIEVKLESSKSYSKRHVAHYIIRDHFSGLFYVEVTDVNNMFSIFEFLFRAWSKKDHHPLYGVPYGLTVPKNIKTWWPKLVPVLDALTVIPIDVTSGFQGGVRDIRTWEEYLRSSPYKTGHPPDYSEVLQSCSRVCKMLNTSQSRGPSKANVWENSLKKDEIFVPTSIEKFMP